MLAALALLGLGGVVPAPAAAYHSALAEDNVATLTQHQVRGGATSVPGVDCGTRCADWWVQEHRPINGQPSSESLHRELRTTRSKYLKVLPKLRTLGNIGLGVGTFDLGWKIGSGINAKWLKFGIPEKSSTTLHSQDLRFRTTADNVGETSKPMYLPEDGFVWRAQTSSWRHKFFTYSNTAVGCHDSFVPPQGGYSSVSRDDTGCYYQGAVVYGLQHAFYKPENSFPALSPVEDYSTQAYGRETPDWTDKPSTQTQAEQRTRDALHSGDYPDLNEWYDFLLERDGSCDPYVPEPCGDTARRSDKACDLNNGLNDDPARGSDRFAVHTPMTRKHDDGSIVSTALRYGHTWNDDGRWKGWGFRHVAAEHGWGPDEQAATELALSLPPTLVVGGGTYEYTGPEYQRNGAVCVRRVVVRTSEESDEPAPREIITSYGRQVG